MAEAVARAGGVAHLAETVTTRALRGRKRRAETDRQDAVWLRELLAEGRLPEAWIAPAHPPMAVAAAPAKRADR
ncbi:MAG: hypothetical protein WAL63_14850 [Solirubrobacteraceae bacterium]